MSITLTPLAPPSGPPVTTAPPSGPPVTTARPTEAPPPPPAPPPERPRRGLSRLVRGPATDPAWMRPSLLALLATTAVTYLWGLGASGWANGYYSAAVQAGASSWKALFFGSFDAGNAITVDKPPASLWVMSLSARLFGVNSWSILVPEAIMGVLTVALVVACVKRWFRPGAALLAGAIVAFTPVATLMFRFNNPDALLVLLLTAAAYGVTRAIERASWRWLALAGALVGFGFLTKMLQAFVVLPAFALAYLLAAPTALRRRLAHLVGMGVATLAAASWWVAIVELWPASSRPYIGGSTNNSVLDLVFGYNGLGRITGNETGSVGGNGAVGSRWGATGIGRMFNASYGGQISWLLPAALVLLAGGLVLTLRRARTDRGRAALVLWGGWLLVTAVVFSLGRGIIHEYYTVALAPAVGAVVGIGASLLWDARHRLWVRGVLAATVGVTGWWAWQLLGRTPSWNPWLQPLIAVTTVLAMAGLLALRPSRPADPSTTTEAGVEPDTLVPTVGRTAPATVSAPADVTRRWLLRGTVAAALVAGLAGPVAYSVATAATTHDGSLPTAGPTVRGAGGPGGGRFPGGNAAGRFGGNPPTFGGNGPAAFGGNGPGAFGGTPPAFGGNATGAAGGGTGAAAGGGMGGLLNASTPSAALVTALDENAGQYTWVLATTGANRAAGYQLATNHAVLALGGFNGTDQWPTLAQFQQWVAQGKIHYFLAEGGFGGGFGGPGGGQGSSTSSAISSWVTGNFSSTTVGGVTLYDLTQPLTSSTSTNA